MGGREAETQTSAPIRDAAVQAAVATTHSPVEVHENSSACELCDLEQAASVSIVTSIDQKG